jgi:hypothetical protein
MIVPGKNARRAGKRQFAGSSRHSDQRSFAHTASADKAGNLSIAVSVIGRNFAAGGPHLTTLSPRNLQIGDLSNEDSRQFDCGFQLSVA